MVPIPGIFIGGKGGDHAKLLISIEVVYASTGSVIVRRLASGRGEEASLVVKFRGEAMA